MKNLRWFLPPLGALFLGLFLVPVTRVAQKENLKSQVQSILRKEAVSLDAGTQEEISQTVLSLSEQYNINPMLILAMVKVESRFKPAARSNRAAFGLMQVRPIVLKEVGADLEIDSANRHLPLTDPRFNLQVGVRYLSLLINRFGSLHKALMAYNAGPTAVSHNYQNRPVPHSGYQRKVLETYQEFSSL